MSNYLLYKYHDVNWTKLLGQTAICRTPFLIVHGEEDSLCNPTGSKLLHRYCTVNLVLHILYSNVHNTHLFIYFLRRSLEQMSLQSHCKLLYRYCTVNLVLHILYSNVHNMYLLIYFLRRSVEQISL